MAKIITITCNPALDKSTYIQSLVPEKKLHCSKPKLDPGGGGINIARVIRKLGGDAHAVFFAGGYNGDRIKQLLDEEDVSFQAIPIKNDTRENLAVFDRNTNNQYRFIMPGPVVYEEEWLKLLEVIEMQNGVEYFIASGSLPSGMQSDFFARVALIAKQKNARCIIDSSGPPLREALAEGLFLIKPNLSELGLLAGVEELKGDEIGLAAKDLIAKYGCEVIVVSQGAYGALLVTENKTEELKAPIVKMKSSVGAGDSLVAGAVYALQEGKSIFDAVYFGVICGTASTLNEGTGLCNPQDIERLLGGNQKLPR